MTDDIWNSEAQTWNALVPGKHEPRCNERCDGDSHYLEATMSDGGILSALDNLDAVFLGDFRDDDFQGGIFVRRSDVETVVRDALRSDEARRKITEVLAANGVQPNTDAMHSWRCNKPDIYPGYCTCVPELVGDLLDALAGADDE